MLAVLKPAGMVTAAVRARQATALDRTRETLKQMRRRDTRVFQVHEIDREASGVLVFGRTPEAAEAMRRQFRSRKADRLYEALVEGEMPEGGDSTRTIRSRLVMNRRGVAESIADTDAAPTGDDKPRAAVTHLRPVRSGNGYTLVRLRAESDHPNQLRAHMAEIGHPIAGDTAYNAARRDVPRLALHLAEVAFEHPVTRERVRLRAPSPGGFRRTVGAERDEVPEGRGDGPTRATVLTAQGTDEPTHWDAVSEWYDDLLTDRGSDHHEQVLIPGALRLLEVCAGQTILDIACGQGVLSRALAARGAAVVGVDASRRLIELATNAGGAGAEPGGIAYHVGDAQRLEDAVAAPEGGFDSAVCLMALMNIADPGSVLAGASEMLRPGGRLVAVILHPAFRSPRQTSWGWSGARAAEQKQFRRVDAYLGETTVPITMNPGGVAEGETAVTTLTFHRPISRYVSACRRAGLLIDTLEEWASRRESQPGPRADEENRARREIPMFLALRAVKVG